MYILSWNCKENFAEQLPVRISHKISFEDSSSAKFVQNILQYLKWVWMFTIRYVLQFYIYGWLFFPPNLLHYKTSKKNENKQMWILPLIFFAILPLLANKISVMHGKCKERMLRIVDSSLNIANENHISRGWVCVQIKFKIHPIF